MRRRHLIVPALVAATVAGSVAAGSRARAVESTRIATATARDYQIAVTARKSGEDAIPTAVVTVTALQRVGKSWRPVISKRLRGTYFWNTVTGPRAVCQLELETAGAQPRFRPSVVVGLLMSPSLGCGPAQRFDLTPSRR